MPPASRLAYKLGVSRMVHQVAIVVVRISSRLARDVSEIN